MIKIIVEKESEMFWIHKVIQAGVLNASNPYTMDFLGISLRQNIHYEKSDNYEDDIAEKREEYNKRFANKELTLTQIENILRKENNTKTNIDIEQQPLWG